MTHNNMDLLQIATRVASYEDLMEEADPNYQRILNILTMSVKNTLKDLIDSVKSQDEALTLNNMHRLMQSLEDIYKYMGLREYKQKLNALTDKQFGN